MRQSSRFKIDKPPKHGEMKNHRPSSSSALRLPFPSSICLNSISPPKSFQKLSLMFPTLILPWGLVVCISMTLTLSAAQQSALASSPPRHSFFLILDHLIEGKNLTWMHIHRLLMRLKFFHTLIIYVYFFCLIYSILYSLWTWCLAHIENSKEILTWVEIKARNSK